MQNLSRQRENLDRIFSPKSIAVVGTNNNKGTVPHDIFANLLDSDFKGTLYPVSPGCKSIRCFHTYKYVIDIAEPVDMAVLVFPNHVCHLALEQCGKKNIRSVVIISAGFKETGPEGKLKEEQLKDIAEQYDISFIGPNCLGVINTDPNVRLNASFARQMPARGPIAFLSQSGALCTAVLDYAESKQIGFSKFVSFGNKADISETDLMLYLKDDPQTRVILLYLEEITDGLRLMQTAETILRDSGKPILLLKSGHTKEGAAAASSHTGSLAGSDEICDAALRQCGIIRCHDIGDMFETAIALAYQPLPKGNRISIITNAGGPGVLATDAAIQNGLKLAKLGENTIETLRAALPKTANVQNPVDVIGDAKVDRYQIAMQNILADPAVDGIFVILTPQSMTDIETIAQEICRQAAESEKPIYAAFMGEAEVCHGIKILQTHSVPNYFLPESMCKAFGRVYSFTKILLREDDPLIPLEELKKDRVEQILIEAQSNGFSFLSPNLAQEILEAYCIPVAEGELALSARHATEIFNRLGGPVAMKIVSQDILHKIEANGVCLNIASGEEASEAYNSILSDVTDKYPAAKIQGVFVQKMISGGEEVIIGMKRDPAFGTVLLFGLGGTYVEIFKDVSFRIAPIGPKTIRHMIQEIKSYPLLDGARGRKPCDVDSLIRIVSLLSRMVMDCPLIKELDINPLRVMPAGKGCIAIDCKILL